MRTYEKAEAKVAPGAGATARGNLTNAVFHNNYFHNHVNYLDLFNRELRWLWNSKPGAFAGAI